MMDLHTHTVFCDGASTPEEMVLAALDRGLDCLGFSGHSYTFFDESWCMSPLGTAAYRGEIARLRRVYGSRLRILCGVEQDFWSAESTEGYDYVIGSVHYLKMGGEYLPVDESPEVTREVTQRHFGGDPYALAEAYFDTVSQVAEKTGCDIIGHFDLICKFNEVCPAFDEAHPRYTAAWQKALDKLLEAGKPFEINTGAVSRGWRSAAYPRREMIAYVLDRGGRLVLSSDSHSTETLCFDFARYEQAYPVVIRDFDEIKT